MNTIALKRTLVQWQVKEAALILAGSVVLPFLVHLAPPLAGMPLGARMLAMFYAPFIAVVLFRPHVAIITGLLSPVLNSLLTGHPLPERILFLTVEIVVFCVIASFIHQRSRNFPGAAALAYLPALLIASWLFGSLGAFLNILVVSLPGVAILTLLNIALVCFQKR